MILLKLRYKLIKGMVEFLLGADITGITDAQTFLERVVQLPVFLLLVVIDLVEARL